MTRLFAALLLCLSCVTAQAQSAADLFQLGTATHVAVASGAWENPATWNTNSVPDAGAKVWVPTPCSVRVHEATCDLSWIAVAGTLDVCDHCDVVINTHSVYVPMGGRFHLGEPGMPATGQVKLVFLPGDFLPGDWAQLSRGLICMGEFTACGAEKTSWDVIDGDLAAGSTGLKLTNIPYGWKAGDHIIIAGTDTTLSNSDPSGVNRYQTEDRVIAGIAGREVWWTQPLAYKHWRWRADLPFHCANLTRNVVLTSRDPSQVSNRGHVMFMSPTNELRYVQFLNLGRTDKSKAVSDPRLDVYHEFVAGSNSNPRARYACHWHRVGVGTAPCRVSGCVVDGSPGWGFLNHRSNVQIEDSVAVRCYGFGFGTEEGQERGYFRRCLAASCVNPNPINGLPGRRDIGDWGTNGDGFWLQGGLVEIEDCVAFGNSAFGFDVFDTPLNQYPNFTNPSVASWIQFPIEVAAPLLEPSIYGSTNAPSGTVPVRKINRIQSYCNNGGFALWYGHMNQNQVPTQVRNQISNVSCWGGGKAPTLYCEYGSNATFDGVTIVGDTSRPAYQSITKTLIPVHVAAPNVTISRLVIEAYGMPIFDGKPTQNHTIDGTYPIVGPGGVVIR